MKNEDGSILVLTILAVLILSILVTGLLNVGTTELYTTQNYHLSKVSHYTAMKGLEEIRNLLEQNSDPEPFGGAGGSGTRGDSPLGADTGGGPAGTKTTEDGLITYYITGTMENLEDKSPQPPATFEGFPAPKPIGTNIGVGHQSMGFIIYLINVTAVARTGNRVSYSEIKVGIIGTIPVN